MYSAIITTFPLGQPQTLGEAVRDYSQESVANLVLVSRMLYGWMLSTPKLMELKPRQYRRHLFREEGPGERVLFGILVGGVKNYIDKTPLGSLMLIYAHVNSFRMNSSGLIHLYRVGWWRLWDDTLVLNNITCGFPSL